MKNNYIKLFEILSKQEPNVLELIEKFEDLGFFLTDFEAMREERFIFLQKIREKNKSNNWIDIFYIKLAPKGFASLEEYNKNQRQEQINNKTLKATIIIAVATALNVLITLFIFILNLEKSNWAKPVSLIIFGIFIAGLSGVLIKEIWYFLFPRKERK
ncbi:MAG TPA: hypothetical protein ENG87_03755 [Candidatus Pacearchaeota archaeon]|nr:hypothetical protein BMS3Abin17_01069 [archaeon BMS3Abin17]HDK42468.1 hypothetical protein [Candidatus Pacearchaeota archaeon]HDZ61276.1 hypothetical protein [Candidatus Pacearchaeota archaeon]